MLYDMSSDKVDSVNDEFKHNYLNTTVLLYNKARAVVSTDLDIAKQFIKASAGCLYEID
jgi:hypothetical protein